jgi:hypothetical protein
MSFPELHIFTSITTAIFLEASPFLLLGAILSAIVEVMVPADVLTRNWPRNMALQIVSGIGAGFLLPTCECGVVPVVRRLIAKGMPPASAISYLLAAPVVNPLVLVSTYIAFRGEWDMVIARVALVAIPAVILGVFLGQYRARDLLKEEKTAEPGLHNPFPMHDEHASGCACCDDPDAPAFIRILQHTVGEFLGMGKFLILGAAAAAFFKTAVPQELVTAMADNIFSSVGGMMILAILLSICSEADAFVASSFVMFPRVAQLAFIAIGPMVDIKLILMFSAVFKRRIVLILTIVPIFLVFWFSMLLSFNLSDTWVTP